MKPRLTLIRADWEAVKEDPGVRDDLKGAIDFHARKDPKGPWLTVTDLSPAALITIGESLQRRDTIERISAERGTNPTYCQKSNLCHFDDGHEGECWQPARKTCPPPHGKGQKKSV